MLTLVFKLLAFILGILLISISSTAWYVCVFGDKRLSQTENILVAEQKTKWITIVALFMLIIIVP